MTNLIGSGVRFGFPKASIAAYTPWPSGFSVKGSGSFDCANAALTKKKRKRIQNSFGTAFMGQHPTAIREVRSASFSEADSCTQPFQRRHPSQIVQERESRPASLFRRRR